jgi:hypothetical protein
MSTNNSAAEFYLDGGPQTAQAQATQPRIGGQVYKFQVEERKQGSESPCVPLFSAVARFAQHLPQLRYLGDME